MKSCKVEGCEKAVIAHLLCVNHYAQHKRRGLIPAPPTLEQRFWAKVQKTNTCWNWTACGTGNGYGKIGLGGKRGKEILAHRLSFQWANGAIPAGMDVDHTCHNRACVNPAHLRLASRKQNMENLLGANANSRTGVRGVHWHAQRGKWRARVTHNGREYNAGLFDTIREAEEAVIHLRNELFTYNDADRTLSLPNK